MKDSNFFCILPWLHLYVHPDGDVRTCCIGKDSLGTCKEKSLKEIWNSKEIKKIREELLKGKKSKNCESCVNSEYYTNDSMRIGLNNRFEDEVDLLKSQTQPDGSLETFKLQYIDIRFNNLCNFKCRTCNPEFSSSLSAEKNKYLNNDNPYIIFPGKTKFDLDEQLVDHILSLKRIYIAGGEPLVQQNHWNLLEKLIEYHRTDVEITYSTNLSLLTYKGKSVIDYWNKFSNVKVNASLDGWMKGAEYWRKGTNWNQIVHNIEQIKTTTPHVKLGIAPTIGWPNLWNVLDFIDHCIDTMFIDPANMHINLLHTPQMYTLTTLPEFKKKQAVNRIENTIDKLNKSIVKYEQLKLSLKGLIEYTQSESTTAALQTFLKKTNIIDAVRKEDFFTAFPEHLDMKDYLYENYQKTSGRTDSV